MQEKACYQLGAFIQNLEYAASTKKAIVSSIWPLRIKMKASRDVPTNPAVRLHLH
jgi:hypothetical protein